MSVSSTQQRGLFGAKLNALLRYAHYTNARTLGTMKQKTDRQNKRVNLKFGQVLHLIAIINFRCIALPTKYRKQSDHEDFYNVVFSES